MIPSHMITHTPLLAGNLPIKTLVAMAMGNNVLYQSKVWSSSTCWSAYTILKHYAYKCMFAYTSTGPVFLLTCTQLQLVQRTSLLVLDLYIYSCMCLTSYEMENLTKIQWLVVSPNYAEPMNLIFICQSEPMSQVEPSTIIALSYGKSILHVHFHSLWNHTNSLTPTFIWFSWVKYIFIG